MIWFLVAFVIVFSPHNFFISAIIPFLGVFTALVHLDGMLSKNPLRTSNILCEALYDWGCSLYVALGLIAGIWIVYAGSVK